MQLCSYPICKLSLSFLLLSIMLAGCGGGGSNVQRYYLVNPVAAGGLQFTSDRPLVIEIIDVHIPQYLERFQIAIRSSENRLRFSEANQWGENLRKNLIRTMGRNLSTLLATDDIATPLNRSSSLPDYRIRIHIEQFEQDSDGRVKLVARWQLSDDDGSEPLGTFSADLESQKWIAEGNYDQLVAAMQELYGRLSEDIAGTIIAAETE